MGGLSWRVGTIVALRDETPTARTLTFEIPGWPRHLAGQHVDVRLTAEDGYSTVRSYSIASAANAENRLDLTVERLPNGEVSPYLTEEVVAGDRIELRGPIGGWFVWRNSQTEPVQLIAGGSGIVPLMAMIRTRAASGNTAPFRLLYSLREPSVMYYRDELHGHGADRDGVAVTYVHTRVAPQDSSRPPGRIDEQLVTEATWPANTSPTCYLCGPTAFVERAATLLTAAGNPPERIKTERFGPTGEQR